MSDNRASLIEVAELHGQIAKELVKAIKPEPVVAFNKVTKIDEVVGYKYNAASLAVAVKFVKDQGVTAAPSRSGDIKKLLDALPFRDEDDEESNVVPLRG